MNKLDYYLEQVKKYKIGDVYTIIENGKRLRGKITKITKNGFEVQWNDGSKTIEDKPDPAISKYDI